MILSQDEAICLILDLSQNKEVSSLTKLNKLLARLNLHLIPTGFEFSLNKFGSYCQELKLLEENDKFAIKEYNINNKTHQKYIIKDNGLQLAREVEENKLRKIMNDNEMLSLKNEISELSKLGAGEISDNEHIRLFVDTSDKFKLIQRVNSTFMDLMDLYAEIDSVEENTLTDIKFKALVEYCYYLCNYFKEKRFKNLSDDYDYDAYMFDYYLLFALEKQVIPFLKSNIKSKERDEKITFRYYNYIIDSVKDKHPFSLENPHLKELVIQ